MTQLSNHPKISIIIPSYNQGFFIEKTILSVLNQKYPKYELIIIDGGSTDNTIDILKKYDSYIYYWISEEDNGQSSAVNKGISIATGDFISWQNSDDIYWHNAFWYFAHAYELEAEYDIYYGNYHVINQEDEILWSHYLSSPSLLYQKYRGNIMANQSAFFSKKIINKCGSLDTSLQFAMDHELFLRFMMGGAKAKHIPQFLGAFRIHNASKTGIGNQDSWRKEHAYIREKFDIQGGVMLKINSIIASLEKLYKIFFSKYFFQYLNNKFKNIL